MTKKNTFNLFGLKANFLFNLRICQMFSPLKEKLPSVWILRSKALVSIPKFFQKQFLTKKRFLELLTLLGSFDNDEIGWIRETFFLENIISSWTEVIFQMPPLKKIKIVFSKRTYTSHEPHPLNLFTLTLLKNHEADKTLGRTKRASFDFSTLRAMFDDFYSNESYFLSLLSYYVAESDLCRSKESAITRLYLQ